MEWQTNPGKQAIVKSKYKVGDKVNCSGPYGYEKGYCVTAVGIRDFVGYSFKYKIKRDNCEFEVDELEIEK